MTSDRSHLRPVQPGEKAPAKTRFAKISEAVESGSARDVMASMRKALADKLDRGEVSSNSIASAYKELRELDRLIRLADADDHDEKPAGDVDHGYDASAV